MLTQPSPSPRRLRFLIVARILLTKRVRKVEEDAERGDFSTQLGQWLEELGIQVESDGIHARVMEKR